MSPLNAPYAVISCRTTLCIFLILNERHHQLRSTWKRLHCAQISSHPAGARPPHPRVPVHPIVPGWVGVGWVGGLSRWCQVQTFPRGVKRQRDSCQPARRKTIIITPTVGSKKRKELHIIPSPTAPLNHQISEFLPPASSSCSIISNHHKARGWKYSILLRCQLFISVSARTNGVPALSQLAESGLITT